MASRFVVEIITDGAAWSDPLDSDAVDVCALADELESIARRLRDGGIDGPIIDANGNVSGRYYGEEN